MVLKTNNSWILMLLALLLSCKQEQVLTEKQKSMVRNPTELVDVFLGTDGHGHTYPGATRPFGMVQLSPDNGTEGWDWCSGYHHSDSTIAGFSHTHLSGTGIGDRCDISFMPFSQNSGKATFSHNNENASVGFYQVKLENGIQVDLTASERVGFHNYQFPENSERNVKIDLGFAINWDKPTESRLEMLNDSTVVGVRKSKGWAKQHWVYFGAVFSEPIASHIFENDTLGNASDSNLAIGTKVLGKFSFAESNQPLLVKVGISSASSENALQNIAEEIPHWDFEQVADEAKSEWETTLSKIEANLVSPETDTIFYSALYHAQLSPNLFSDSNGEYKSLKHETAKATGHNRYTVFSLWDTFRATHPLFSILQPEKNHEFLKSMVGFYEESGLLPVWALDGNETNTMTGYHAVPVLADAILKETVNQAESEKMYEAMLASASQNIRGTDFYREFGYIPADKDGWSVTKTLEYAFDDWCIAQVAKKLGKQADYEEFTKRANYYKNLFDSETGFMRAKNSDGKFTDGFDPFHSEHGFDGMYIEGTAWQHTWFVPHDVAGMIQLYGSKEAFTKKLDDTFSASSEITGENASVDITGLIGQYAHGNEPSHHVAYLYNYAGEAWKTQEKVRQIMTELYTSGVDGLVGNDDCGQMSAWYVFSALGFYPVNPADGNYVIGSPLVKHAKVKVSDSKTFEIMAENNSLENKYVQSVSLNGKELTRSYITHKELMDGGKLEFTMGINPINNCGYRRSVSTFR